MMFYLYNLMCMNGFVIAYFFEPNLINFRSAKSMSYVYNQYYSEAILIANIVLLTFVFSADMHTTNKKFKNSDLLYSNEEGSKFIDAIIVSVLVFCMIYLVYVIFSNNIFLAKYKYVLLINAENNVLPHTIVLSSLGIAALFSTGTKKGIKIGGIIYAFIMILHFSIGNRGEVLYAGVVIFALYSLRFKNIKTKHIIVLGTIIVILIPMVRIMRSEGDSIYSFNPFSSLLEVLCEEGFQISPFTYIVEYIHNGHTYKLGMTYFNDFLDFLMRRIGLSSPFMKIESNVIKEIMPYKGMGFSMIAELYYNFTIMGACFIYSIFSRFLTRVDHEIYYNQITSSKRLLYSMLIVEMINVTRNDASTVPLYLAYSFIIYFFFIANMKKTSKPITKTEEILKTNKNYSVINNL